MNLIDSNQDGKISLGEFQEYTDKQQATQGDNRAQIEMGLEALDLNQDGNLDRSELPGMDQLPDDQWAIIMNLTDTNQDGKISFREYQEYSSKQQVTQGDELGGSQVEGSGGQQESCDPVSAGTTCPWRPVERCLDNNPYTDCRTDTEPNPWIVLRYDTTIQVTEVALTKVLNP